MGARIKEHRPDRSEDFLDDEVVAEINITPLTDIFLVLLIIFMVTATALTQSGINVNLPKSSEASTATHETPVIVAYSDKGDIYVNEKKVTMDRFPGVIRDALSRVEDKTVILEGDRKILLGQAVEIMDISKKEGATRIAIATSSER